MPRALIHIEELEAKSIQILREVSAGFARPLLRYSTGKDSVLVRLARRGFYPAKVPFKLLHIDTGYKFSEMINFRDRFCADENMYLIVFKAQEYLRDKRRYLTFMRMTPTAYRESSLHATRTAARLAPRFSISQDPYALASLQGPAWSRLLKTRRCRDGLS